MTAINLGWDKYEDANKDPDVICWMVAKDSKIGYNILHFDKLPAPSQSKTPDAFYDRGLVDFFKKEIKSLKQECEELKKMVGQLAEIMEDDFTEVRVMPYKQAKKEIAKYFRDNDGQEIDYIDIVDDLKLPLPQVVKVCENLEKEGKIGAVD